MDEESRTRCSRCALTLFALATTACFPFGEYQSTTGGGPATGGGGDGEGAATAGGGTPEAPSAIRIGNGGRDTLLASAVDNAGNVAIVARFPGSLELAGEMLEAEAGNEGVYVAKLGRDLDIQWAYQLARAADRDEMGSPLSTIASLAFALDGDIVVAGTFAADIQLDDGPHLNDGYDDIYVARFSSSGQLVSSRTVEPENTQSCAAVAVRPQDGNVFLFGQFNVSIAFEGCPEMPTTPGSGIVDLFVAELDADLQCQNLASFTSNAKTRAASIAVEPEIGGDVVISGLYEGALVIPGAPTALPLATGTTNVFIARLGNLLQGELAVFVGEQERGGGYVAVERASDGEILFAGSMPTPLMGGTAELGGFDLVTGKLDAEGLPFDLQAFGGDDNDGGFIRERPDGGFRAYGVMHGPLTFGSRELNAGDLGYPVADLSRSMEATAVAVELPTVLVQPFGAGVFIDSTAGGELAEMTIGTFQGTLKTGNAELVNEGGYDIFITRHAL